MIENQILLTKLIAPASQHAVISRPRLSASHALPRVTIVCAAAGYGKTVLMADWASGTTLPTAWLSLDVADNDPIRFLLHFIAALRRAFPEFGGAIAAALQSQQPPSPVAAAHLLINQISVLPGELLYFVDDYHVVSDQGVHEIMANLIQHQPQQLRLIVGSRSAVPFALARLRAQGHLLEIEARDLRFTPDETGRFMREGMKLELEERDINVLESRTEGWVAGLQLAAVSLKHQPDKAAFIKKFSGMNVHVAQFLIDEVLPLQSRETEEFLLRTAILERFCPALCNAVTGRTDSRAMIDSLERQNLFLVRLDSENTWYRYHHLFASLLRARLDTVLPDERSTLHRRASDWHAEQARPSEAIEHALAAQEFELAADLIERNGYELSSHGRTTAILNWVRQLPETALSKRPALCLTCAWSNFFINDMTGLEFYISKAEYFLQHERSAPYSEQEQVMLGQAALLRSCQMRYQGDSENAMRLARHAVNFFSPDRVLHGAALGCVAICHLARGEVGMAIACFEKITDISARQRNLLVPLTAVLGLGRSYLMSGRLQTAESVYRKALRECTECGWQDLPVCGMLHIGLGELAYERNDLSEAEALLEKGIAMTSKGVQYISDWGQIMLAQTQVALNLSHPAWSAEKEIELSKYLNTHVVDVQRPAISLLRLWLQQGRMERIAQWVADKKIDAKNFVDAESELECLIFVRWLLACARYEEARATLAQMRISAQAGGRNNVLIEIDILDALALQGSNDSSAALKSLAAALTLARPERFIRVFINEGAQINLLLQRLILSGSGDDFTRELLNAFGKKAPLALADAAEPLTAKEEKIIQCLAQDLSNQKIADTLFISLNTVKTHLKNVYRKLGVNNRHQAIERIRHSALS